jgi:hypothetical protein
MPHINGQLDLIALVDETTGLLTPANRSASPLVSARIQHHSSR